MGTLTFQATAGGSVNLLGPNISGTVNLTLPSADGTSGQPLQTNGSGTLSFANLAIANGGTGATSFVANQIHYGSFSQSANLTFDGTNAGIGAAPTASTRLTLSDTNPSKLVITGGTNQNGMLLNAVSTSNQYYISSGVNLLNSGDKGFLIYDATNARAKFFVEDVVGETRTLATTFLSYYTGGSERMRIDSSGNVGIGTNLPTTALHVLSTATGATASAIIQNAGATATSLLYFKNSAARQMLIGYTGASYSAGEYGTIDVIGAFPLVFSTNDTERMRISSAGIVTMSAYGAGAATFSASGVISSVSDETWKIKDGVPVDPDSMLKKLEPGYWYYNDEKKEIFGVDRQLGFYAQNVNAAIGPEAAPTPEEGKPWGYYDRSVLAVTVMSLQKALATIESLTARITALEST